MQLDLREATRFLSADESTIQKWVRRGDLRARKVNDQLLFDHVDLFEFASAHGIDVPPEMLVDPAAKAQPLPRLVDAVRKGGVHADVPGTDKASALRAVVDRLRIPPELDRSFLHQMLLARENLGSTGFGHGIAIPHPRHPIVLRVLEPSVSVSYLANPVEFDAVDGRPVHTLFTLISPSVRVHLHLLALLAAALRDADVLSRIEARAPEADLVEALGRVEEAVASRRPAGPGKSS